ncbi:16600_t:CDS:2 [Acaulospora morrowiae]|uniref:16600_t:CDS:1 n=1 Tax=Acaulospora morrowiae TaxID=94023 RepID=A0A9N8VA37_9GLOM|nr:16600_t:CDS:2 [Acaulospora morrowiae]
MFSAKYLKRPPRWLTISQSRAFSSTKQLLARKRPGGRKRSTSEFDIEFLPEYQFDSTSKPGYEILFAQAEIRSYLRKTKYELPQLAKFSKPYIPPTSDQILLFKRSYYIGEEHPLQNKAVLAVKLSDLSLTPEQGHKFKLLCSTRFDGDDTFKFSCEKFPHLAQNKKYLRDLIDRLLEAAKAREIICINIQRDPTDSFADLPVDLRHLKRKKIIRFPPEWRRPPKEKTEENSVNQESTFNDIAAMGSDPINADDSNAILETVPVKHT